MKITLAFHFVGNEGERVDDLNNRAIPIVKAEFSKYSNEHFIKQSDCYERNGVYELWFSLRER